MMSEFEHLKLSLENLSKQSEEKEEEIREQTLSLERIKSEVENSNVEKFLKIASFFYFGNILLGGL